MVKKEFPPQPDVFRYRQDRDDFGEFLFPSAGRSVEKTSEEELPVERVPGEKEPFPWEGEVSPEEEVSPKASPEGPAPEAPVTTEQPPVQPMVETSPEEAVKRSLEKISNDPNAAMEEFRAAQEKYLSQGGQSE